MAASGLFISWATPAAMRPKETSLAECGQLGVQRRPFVVVGLQAPDEKPDQKQHRRHDEHRGQPQHRKLQLVRPGQFAQRLVRILVYDQKPFPVFQPGTRGEQLAPVGGGSHEN